jgi:YHS domain-containing protein
MKQLLTISAFALLAISCGGSKEKNTESATEHSHDDSAPHENLLIVSTLHTDKDVVCNMPGMTKGCADTLTYAGKTYGFCAKECKDEFVKNPTAYAQK